MVGVPIGGKELALVLRFSGMERHTRCIARGVGYLLTCIQACG